MSSVFHNMDYEQKFADQPMESKNTPYKDTLNKKLEESKKKVEDKDPREMLEVAADDAQGKSFPISPLQAAEAIFQGIENNDFYIFTHKGYEEHIQHIADEYIAAFDQAKYQ